MAVGEDPRARFDAICARRTCLGVSVARLCRKADIHQSTWQQLIRDPKRAPNFRTVQRLEKAMTQFEREPVDG